MISREEVVQFLDTDKMRWAMETGEPFQIANALTPLLEAVYKQGQENAPEVSRIRAEAFEEAEKGLAWLGAQGNVPRTDSAWAGVEACRAILRGLAGLERSKYAD